MFTGLENLWYGRSCLQISIYSKHRINARWKKRRMWERKKEERESSNGRRKHKYITQFLEMRSITSTDYTWLLSKRWFMKYVNVLPLGITSRVHYFIYCLIASKMYLIYLRVMKSNLVLIYSSKHEGNTIYYFE